MSLIEIAAGPEDKTQVIQSAIDRTSVHGGGIVALLAGSHRSAGLRLKSGVELCLRADAILEFTPNYDLLSPNRVSVIAEGSDRALIVAQGERAIAVSGEGMIRAPGHAYIAGDDPEAGTHLPAKLRPRVLVIEDCNDVRIERIRIVDSPMWTVHLVGCTGVTVTDLRIENDQRLPNTDGIVIDSCHNVRIEAADISTADDGICLKTTIRPSGIGSMTNIHVRGCRISSQSCALKIGTETFGDITGVVFEDCAVVDSNRALGIFSRDGGAIRHIRFSRIAVDCHETPIGFWGSGEALTVTVVDRRAERPAGPVLDVMVEDISGVMEGAINLISTAPRGIRGVRLARVAITQRPGKLGTGRFYDLRPTSADLAPSPLARGRANAWTKDAGGRVIGLAAYPGGLPGVYARGVADLDLDEVEIARPQPLPDGWSSEVVTAT